MKAKRRKSALVAAAVSVPLILLTVILRRTAFAPLPDALENVYTSAHYEETMLTPHHIQRRYFAKLDEEEFCIGESFGFQIDDYIVDLNGDGAEELVCNCVYGGDGAKRVLIYRLQGGIAEQGQLPKDEALLPGLNGWGANAVSEIYDADVNCVVVTYSTENGVCSAVCGYDDFVFTPFTD